MQLKKVKAILQSLTLDKKDQIKVNKIVKDIDLEVNKVRKQQLKSIKKKLEENNL